MREMYTEFMILFAAISVLCLIRSFRYCKYSKVARFVTVFVLLIMIGLSAYLLPSVFDGTFHEQSVYIIFLIYGAVAILSFLFSFEYAPMILTSTMFGRMITDIDHALLFFDKRGECLFVNQSASKLFGITKNDRKEIDKLLSELAGDIDKMDNGISVSMRPEFASVRYYRTEYHPFKDKKKNVIAYFYEISDYTNEEITRQEREYLASHDASTELYNSDYFIKEVERRLKADTAGNYYIATFHIKNYRIINDIYGREIGEEILLKMADTLKQLAGPDALYCRASSENFSLFIRKEEFNEENYLKKLPTIVKTDSVVTTPFNIQIGIYEITDRTISASIMLGRASMALASIQQDYTANVAYFNENMRENLVWRQKILSQFMGALEKGHLVPYLQPQVDVNGNCNGAEMLVRWKHPEEGLLPPAKFVGILEENGMVSYLDHFMWQSACQILEHWKRNGVTDKHISVNISPKDFYYVNAFDSLKDLTESYDFPKEQLHLEITEDALITTTDEHLKNIEALKNLGFVTEMDDFGSGFSSLNMLKNMDVDMIKIDMEFLKNVQNEKKLKIILQMIIDMAKKLGIDSLCEGVESKEQFEMLKEMGCNYFQGYLFDKSMTVAEFESKYLW
ncbi:MAG: GGDEF domain-containing phosphodiesterase [Lachnospiraceae bacterium]|nr:GGDEF domain-containing phosphodiesterase [Lachnospiraceae bacterium]